MDSLNDSGSESQLDISDNQTKPLVMGIWLYLINLLVRGPTGAQAITMPVDCLPHIDGKVQLLKTHLHH